MRLNLAFAYYNAYGSLHDIIWAPNLMVKKTQSKQLKKNPLKQEFFSILKNKGAFSLLNKTKQTKPDLPFEKMKDKILGKSYSLSLVFAGDGLSKKLNKEYRGKNKATNILSFSLEKKEGEIFINLSKVRKEAKKMQKSFKKHVAYLFIHGLLHLKGFEHGSKMDSEEEKYMKIFNM